MNLALNNLQRLLWGCVLGSNHEMCHAFQAHFCDCFACCLYLRVQEFRSYLTDFPHLQMVEVAICEGLVTECEVCYVLKQVGLNKSPGLNGLLNEVYLRLPYMFVPILIDYVQPLVRPGSHPWQCYQGRDHIAEERGQAYLGGA